MIAYQFKKLIQDFLINLISASDFERSYIDMFLDQKRPVIEDEQLFRILNELFFEVDAYWHEATPETETEFEISEKTLRARAKKALEELDQYIYNTENRSGESN